MFASVEFWCDLITASGKVTLLICGASIAIGL
jgi:hypothetical protein